MIIQTYTRESLMNFSIDQLVRKVDDKTPYLVIAIFGTFIMVTDGRRKESIHYKDLRTLTPPCRPARHGDDWPEADILFLQDHWGLPTDILSKLMGRTVTSIRSRKSIINAAKKINLYTHK